MHKRYKRKPYQKVTSNIQHIAGNYNNQAGRDINYFSYMHAKPKNIELSPVKNYELYYYIFTFMVFIVLMIIGFDIAKIIFDVDLMKSPLFMIWFFVSIFISILSVIATLDWAFKKFKWGHIKYKDGVFEYDGVKSKFYEDIWSVELKRGFMNKGKIEYFGINSRKNKVYSVKIVLMRYHEAKYLHDIFWSGLKNQVDHKQESLN